MCGNGPSLSDTPENRTFTKPSSRFPGGHNLLAEDFELESKLIIINIS